MNILRGKKKIHSVGEEEGMVMEIERKRDVTKGKKKGRKG